MSNRRLKRSRINNNGRMKKKALFGGSFDPPHFGHLNLAIEMLERYQFEKVFWIPAARSPFKEEVSDPGHRLEMVKLATKDIAQFEVLDLEIKRKPPSYTIDTLEELNCDPDHFSLLLADDIYHSFSQWKEAKKIEQKVEILVVSRGNEGISIPKMEISASRIRERLKKGLYCGHLLPANVLDYIYENQLYYTA